jgi:TonB family protein
MLVRVAIDPQGNITHMRVLRLAYPASPGAQALNEAVLDRVKRLKYKPFMVSGKAVTVFSDVAVAIDF